MGKKNGKIGRKLRLQVEPRLLDEICELFANGCAIRTVAECVGIGVSTFHQWMDFGDPDSDKYDERYKDFADRVRRARGRGKATLIEAIQRHVKIDGRLGLELLSRLSPEEYGKAFRSRASDSDGEALATNFPAPATVKVVYQHGHGQPLKND